MDIVLVAFVAEVKVVADRALVTRAIEVLLAAPIACALVCVGILYRRRRRGSSANGCAGQGAKEHIQERLTLAVGAPRASLAGT